jgi:hypothetical protein
MQNKPHGKAPGGHNPLDNATIGMVDEPMGDADNHYWDAYEEPDPQLYADTMLVI